MHALPCPGLEGLGASNGVSAGSWAQLPLPRAQPPHWANWNSWLGQTAPPTHSRLEPRSHPPLRACSWGPGSSRHTGSPVCRRWPPPCSPPPALPKSSPAASSLTWGFLWFSHLLTHQTGSGYEAGGGEDLEGSYVGIQDQVLGKHMKPPKSSAKFSMCVPFGDHTNR